MKTGRLTEFNGYVPYQKSVRFQQEEKAWNGTPQFIASNLVVMIPIALITLKLVRKALLIHGALVKWLTAGAVAAAGIFVILFTVFFFMLAFYDGVGRGVPRPGGAWVDGYDRDMTVLVATKLLGHEPRGMWHDQLEDGGHLLVNPEILLITYTDSNFYLEVPAGDIDGLREVSEHEVKDAKTLKFDPNAEVASLLPGEPGTYYPFHAPGRIDVNGPFQIQLKTARPRAIWFRRMNYPKENVNNDQFLVRVMDALQLDTNAEQPLPTK